MYPVVSSGIVSTDISSAMDYVALLYNVVNSESSGLEVDAMFCGPLLELCFVITFIDLVLNWTIELLRFKV